MMRYRALLFDLDNTLLDFSAAEAEAVRQTFSQMGLRTDRAAVEQYSAINVRFWQAHERGELTTDQVCVERFRRFFAQTGQQGDPVATDRLYKDLLGSFHYLMPHCRQTLTALKQRGYRLYVITNGLKDNQHRRLRESGLDRLIEKAYISEELGVHKPLPAFFEKVCADVGLPVAELLVIGDSMTSDVQGALAAGIDVCWLALPGQERLYDTTYTVNTLPELLDFL